MASQQTLLPPLGTDVQVPSGASSKDGPSVSVYGAAKSGGEGLFRGVAVEVAADGVTPNANARG